MSPIETSAVLVLLIAAIAGLALAIYWPIRWAVLRHPDQLEDEMFTREYAVFNQRGRDRVL